MVLEILVSFLTAPAFGKTESSALYECLVAVEHIERRGGLRAENRPPYAIVDPKTQDLSAVIFPLDDFSVAVIGPEGPRLASLQIDQIEKEAIDTGQKAPDRFAPQRRRLVLPHGDEVFLDLPYDKSSARLLGSQMTVKSVLLENPQDLQKEIDALKKKLALHQEILKIHRQADEARCAEEKNSVISIVGRIFSAIVPRPGFAPKPSTGTGEKEVPIEIQMDYESIRNVMAQIAALEKSQKEEPEIRRRIKGRVPVLQSEPAEAKDQTRIEQFTLERVLHLAKSAKNIASPARGLWVSFMKKSCGEIKWQGPDRMKFNQALELKK